jgi:hypothetical protein
MPSTASLSGIVNDPSVIKHACNKHTHRFVRVRMVYKHRNWSSAHGPRLTLQSSYGSLYVSVVTPTKAKKHPMLITSMAIGSHTANRSARRVMVIRCLPSTAALTAVYFHEYWGHIINVGRYAFCERHLVIRWSPTQTHTRASRVTIGRLQ